MRRGRIYRAVALSGCVVFLAACVKPPSAEIHRFGKNRLLYTDGSKRHTLIKLDRSYLRICAEPSPDVTVSEEQAFGFDLSLNLAIVGNAGSKEKTDTREESGFTEGELTGRTPSVLLARELLFRLCELGINADLSAKAMMELHKRVLDIIEKVSLAEAKNTKVTIGETLSKKEVKNLFLETSGGKVPGLQDPGQQQGQGAGGGAGQGGGGAGGGDGGAGQGGGGAGQGGGGAGGGDGGGTGN